MTPLRPGSLWLLARASTPGGFSPSHLRTFDCPEPVSWADVQGLIRRRFVAVYGAVTITRRGQLALNLYRAALGGDT